MPAPVSKAPLKASGQKGVFTPPAASSLAAGLNVGTVVSVQNHWREFYNPLRALDMPRAIALYDFARRGLNAELQNVYREMEGLFPTLIGLIERRTSPLLEMEWEIKIPDQEKLPSGASLSQAEDQAAALRDAYDNIDNLYDAIEWMELGAFRGFAHLEKIYAHPGTSDWAIEHLEPVEQWHWTRKSMYAEWEYVAAATQTNVGTPIDYGQWIIHEVRRPLDRIALILWIRANLCEKDWDAFVEIYGIPAWIITMPDNVPKEKESEYRGAALRIAEGGRGALPSGSTAVAAKSEHNGTVFRPRLDWLQEQLVLAGTGGLLSMLAMPTGMNDSTSSTHDDAFKKIARKEARKISEALNHQFDTPILDRTFPGAPHLAWFELCAKEETDPAAICAQALQLSQAGYQMAAGQLQEKTGYTITLKAAPPQDTPPSDDPAENPSFDPSVPSDPILNRAAAEVSASLIDTAAKQYAGAQQAAFKSLADRLYGILELDDPALETSALKKLNRDLNDPKSDLLTAIMQDDGAAKVLASAMSAGFLNGVAANEAGRTIVKNRILNGGPADEPRDDQGRWSSAGVSPGHIKLTGSKLVRETDKAVLAKVRLKEGSHEVWLPKSQSSIDASGTVHASNWIIDSKHREFDQGYNPDLHGEEIQTGEEKTPEEKAAGHAKNQENAIGSPKWEAERAARKSGKKKTFS